MAGDPSLQLTWHLSGGSGNTDADDSLGGARATQQIAAWATTVSANGAAGDVRVFLASVASASIADAWIYFRDGNSGGWGASVVACSTGSGWVDLLEPLPTSIGIGDSVWFFGTTLDQTPFKNTSALESALGIVHYCGLYIKNGTGTLSNLRMYLERLGPGAVVHEIAASNDPTHVLATISDEEEEPDLSSMLAGGGAGRFVAARSYADGSPELNLGSGQQLGFWLKRIGPEDALRHSDQAIAIVAETDGGFQSKAVLNWNTAGFTPLITLTHAPTVYLRGGARFKAVVRDEETGLVVSGVPVIFTKTDGPGELAAPPDPGVTDDDGKILARYAAPIDVGEIDSTFTIEAAV